MLVWLIAVDGLEGLRSPPGDSEVQSVLVGLVFLIVASVSWKILVFVALLVSGLAPTGSNGQLVNIFLSLVENPRSILLYVLLLV